MNTDDPYEQWWREIDSLEQEGLPRSALEKAGALYERIDAVAAPAQSVKCLLYVNKYQQELSEDGLIVVIANLEEAIAEARPVRRAVLQSVLARVYASYLEDNFWRFNDRTDLDEVDDSDPQTWPVARFVERITELFMASVSEERTREVPIGQWTALLTEEKGETDQLRPFLYDFLAHQAIDYFRDDRYFLPEPVYVYRLDDEQLFAPAGDFAALSLEARDSGSFKFLALTILQDALAFHLEDEDPAALVDLDLKRLRFVHQHSVLPDKEMRYREALEALMAAHNESPASAQVMHALANSYYQSGLDYDALEDTTNRWDFKKAHELCREAIEKFPESYGAAHCQRLIAQIERRTFSLRTEEVYLPDQPRLGRLSFRNVQTLYFRRVEMHKLDRMEVVNMRPDDLRALLYEKEPQKSWSVDLPDTEDFQEHAVEIELDALELGFYALLVSDVPDFPVNGEANVGYLFYQVSRLAYLTQRGAGGQTDFVVMDRAEGNPLEAVLLECHTAEYNRKTRRSDYKFLTHAYTNEQGKAVLNLPDNQYYQVKFVKGDDILFFPDGHSKYGRYNTFEDRETVSTVFFLDRQIYRPGQTVYFKGLAYAEREGERPRILANREVTVRLLDVNGQEAATVELRTNEYGAFNGSFTAPRNGLLGAMRLTSSLGNDQHYFRVEEYKRPKFEVVFDTLQADYQLGDTVAVTAQAKAYAGSAIDGAQVRYRVTREVRFPWRPWWMMRSFPVREETMEIQSGELQTDAEGRFTIRFPAMAAPEIDPEQKPLFYFRVYADVTDITGETHSAEKSTRLGYIGLIAGVETPEQLDRAAPFEAAIKTENLEGLFQPATGEVQVYRLDAPEQIFLERYWEKPDLKLMDREAFTAAFPQFAYGDEDEVTRWDRTETVFTTSFNSARSRKLTLPVDQWPVGHYLLELTTTDSKGNTITDSGYFWVYDSKAGQIPANVVYWAPESAQPYEPGDTYPFLLASATPELNVLWGMERKETMEREEWATVRQWEEVPYEIVEEDKGNIFFHFAFVRDNRAYRGSRKVSVPWSEKELQITFGTFRDKLRPGAAEEWEIKISGHKKEAVAAEVAAAMYDQSLDVFAPNNWSFFPYATRSYAQTNWQIPHFTDRTNNQLAIVRQAVETPSRVYRDLNWSLLFMRRRYLRAGGRVVSAQGYSIEDGAAAEAAAERDMMATQKLSARSMAAPKSAEAPPPPTEAEDDAGQVAQAAPIRKNLEETVFFFPDLRTDAEGNVILRFTMKEALTRWKLLLLAHTKELAIGTASRSVVTQKELMVMPNPPRFFREGDEIVFTAKVSNLTEKALPGEARLELYNPINEEIITDQLLVSQAELSFEAPAGQSAGLRWTLRVPAGGISALGHRVVAQADGFSDGEQSVAPVLTNRVLITETMPLTVRGGEREEFTFSAMEKAARSETLEHKRFSLEFTANPAWYAVKALPYLMEYPYECTEQIFSRYYANTLAASVANEHPQIKSVFEDWKNTGGLESNLMQNEELKTVLLQETPWVLQAQSQAEQRRRLGLLFDLNRMAEEQSVALYKMVENQSDNGGFPWFPGGRESWFITQYIVEGMGRLQALGVQDIQQNSAAMQMLRKAISFIDEEVQLHYIKLKERVEAGQTEWEDDHLNSLVIHYLYARSLFPQVELAEEMQEIHTYYIGQANRHWLARGIYEQGLLALALTRKGLHVTPAKIVQSLKERALRDDELGMYWKYDRGFYWHQMPIETHALMIEVFSEIEKDAEAVDALKRWLLRNKQTNDWKTTKATAAAVYALLSYGANWLLNEQDVQIRFRDLPRRRYKDQLAAAQQTAEAGTGYFQVDWKGAEVSADMTRVKVKNPNEQLAWGALYWQYLEEADKVTAFEDTPLTIRKQVFKAVQTDRGPQLQSLEAGAALEPGDKLTVRIELRVDREMEYVHMKDMRASGFEPINVFSRYQWQGGLGYYESTRDAATHFFFDRLPRGTHVFEYPLRVVHEGDFSNGVTTVQCMYAPEFTSHSEGIRLQVE